MPFDTPFEQKKDLCKFQRKQHSLFASDATLKFRNTEISLTHRTQTTTRGEMDQICIYKCWWQWMDKDPLGCRRRSTYAHLNKEADYLFFHIELTVLRDGNTGSWSSLVWSSSDQFPSTEWGINVSDTATIPESRVTTHDFPVAFTEVFWKSLGKWGKWGSVKSCEESKGASTVVLGNRGHTVAFKSPPIASSQVNALQFSRQTLFFYPHALLFSFPVCVTMTQNKKELMLNDAHLIGQIEWSAHSECRVIFETNLLFILATLS